MGIIDKQLPPDQAMPEDQAAQPEADGQDEQDPSYQQALKFAMDALYKSGAAKQIAQQIASSDSPSDALADAAYNIVSITDEKTNGAVPDELLVLFASSVLKEVADIAEAAGVKVKSTDLAEAMKTMILRYLGEQGVDTSQLESAMSQVDPSTFDQQEDEEQAEPAEAEEE